MTEGVATIPALDPLTLPADDDPIFGFLLKDWKELPDLELSLDYLSETDEQRYERIHDETEHRNMNSITAWHRFATLGRYVVTFTTFTHLWNTSASDPLRLHLLIWFQCMYFLENKIGIPKKLQDWAQFRSQDYLSKHAEEALQLDTSVDEIWEIWANQMTISFEWKNIISKSKQKKSKGKSSGKKSSKMKPNEMRSFIAPSLSTMPTRSMIVIPIRFGFTNKTHVTWRNQPKTKEALEHNNFTASFSNS